MVVFYKIYKQYSEIQLTKKQNGHEQFKIAILEIKNLPLLKKNQTSLQGVHFHSS